MSEVAARTDAAEEEPAAAKQYELNVFEVWKEYEKIAIHFNDLLMKLRVQALGVVTAIAAVAGIVLKEAGKIQWEMLNKAFLGLVLFWLAVAVLDFAYYTRLLHGAINAIKELEEASKRHAEKHAGLISLNLSTTIESKFGSGANKWRRHAGPVVFYSLIFILLSLLLIWSYFQANQERGAGSSQGAGSPTLLMPKGSSATLSLDQGTDFSLSADGKTLTINAK